jgi:6-pyruvoyl-tetrahydropterin synthase
MIVDFGEMKQICEGILKKLDHRDLSELFDMPTSENITNWIFESLSSVLPLRRVTFFEGNGKWCTVEV